MPHVQSFDASSLFYREWGAGPPILFLNSWAMTSDMWGYQFAAFADAGYRCIGFDRRGHGRSDVPAGGYDFDSFADDLAALIGSLDLTDVTLIGHSMGGGEIVRYLTRHGSGRVARIVLLAPITPKPIKDAENPEGFERADFEAIWSLWRRDFHKWIDDNLAPFFIPETSRPMMQWVVSLLQTSVEVALACSQAIADADFRAEMRNVDAPCLLIQGDRDRSVPIEMSGRPSAELLRNCRFLIYEGAPHGLMFTHMDQVHADILAFLSEAPEATSTETNRLVAA